MHIYDSILSFVDKLEFIAGYFYLSKQFFLCGQHKVVFRLKHSYVFTVAKRIFYHRIILVGTQDYTHRRIIIGLTHFHIVIIYI